MNLEYLVNIIESVSVTLASIVAIFGITSWRKEAKWKRKFELTEEVLSLFYEAGEIFKIIRNPFSYNNEGESRVKGENESPEDSKILDQAYVTIERYENEKESFLKLKSLKYKFGAVFGKDKIEPFEEINKHLNKLMNAAYRLGYRHWRDQGRRIFSEKEFQKHLKKMQEYEDIIWSINDSNDEFSKEINRTIMKMEKICNEIIKK